MAEDAKVADRVADWLEKQGYPLEMRTAREFRAADISVDVNRYHVDSESGRQREIDIYATFESKIGDSEKRVEVAVAIECKSARDKPWILLTDDEWKPNGVHFWWHRIDSPQHWLSSLQEDVGKAKDRSAAGLLPLLYPRRDSIGYSLVRAFAGGNEDVAFGAMASATKAALSMRENVNARHEFVGEFYTFSVIYPVVLVDAPLMRCDLGDDGQPRLRAIDRGTVAWRYSVGPNSPSVTTVTVATVAELPRLAEDMKRTAEGLANLLNRYPPKLKRAE